VSLCGGERAKRIAGRRHAAGGRRQVAAGSRRRQRAAHGRTAAPGGGSSGPGRVNAAAPAASPRPRVGLGISIGSSHGCRDASAAAAAACGSRLASRTTNRRSPRRALAKIPLVSRSRAGLMPPAGHPDRKRMSARSRSTRTATILPRSTASGCLVWCHRRSNRSTSSGAHLGFEAYGLVVRQLGVDRRRCGDTSSCSHV